MAMFIEHMTVKFENWKSRNADTLVVWSFENWFVLNGNK